MRMVGVKAINWIMYHNFCIKHNLKKDNFYSLKLFIKGGI